MMKAVLLFLWLIWPSISLGKFSKTHGSEDTTVQLVIFNTSCDKSTHGRVYVTFAPSANLRSGKKIRINNDQEVLQYSLGYRNSFQKETRLLDHQTVEFDEPLSAKASVVSTQDSFTLCLARGTTFSIVLHSFSVENAREISNSNSGAATSAVRGGLVCGRYFTALEQPLVITPAIVNDCDSVPSKQVGSGTQERSLTDAAPQRSESQRVPTARTEGRERPAPSIWNLFHLLEDSTPAPTQSPTMVPTVKPTRRPKPSAQPTQVPTSIPTSIPTSYPTAVPTPPPTSIPTSIPTSYPSPEPTSIPTANPTQGCDPTPLPSSQPSTQPTSQPSIPTSQPSSQPSCPSSQPSSQPTSPTPRPTVKPTALPTFTPAPSLAPTRQPTAAPTCKPSAIPTAEPSRPTAQPTVQPSAAPTVFVTDPTAQPTTEPTAEPTAEPTVLVTLQPTHVQLNSTTTSNSTADSSSTAAFIQTTAGIGTVVGAGTAGVATVASASYYLLKASRELVRVPLAPANMAMQI